MRLGQNPAKSTGSVSLPEKVTITIVTHVPFLSGYHAEGLEVLETCLNSLWENTPEDYDLMVFDNASCSDVRDYLLEAQDQGRIQYLVLSEENVGKARAWNFLFGAAPGEYVAYADSDVYFYPGWLSALLGVMEAFPQSGMVTGMPVLNPQEFSTRTLQWVQGQEEVRLERGRLLPWEDFWRHAGTLGSDEIKAREFYNQNEAVCLVVGDQKYFVGAGHFQFLAPRKVLQQVLPIASDRPMGDVRQLDSAINELGYLRLSTSAWWVEHIGNSLQGWELRSAVEDHSATPRVKPSPKLWSWKPMRKFLTIIHDKSFELLYRN